MMRRSVIESDGIRHFCSMMGVDMATAIGVIESLFHMASRMTPKGNIGVLSDEIISSGSNVPSNIDPGKFMEALENSGFIVRDNQHRFVICDWAKNADEAAKKYMKRNGVGSSEEKQPDHTPTKKNKASSPVGMKSVETKSVMDEPETIIKKELDDEPKECPKKSIDVFDLIKPVESQSKNPVCHPSKNGKKNSLISDLFLDDEPNPTEEPPILTYPCAGIPNQWHLTQSQIDQWKELFPTLDILRECKVALAWVDADLSRRKTAKGMKRYLVQWFGRSQDRGKGRFNEQPKARMPVCKRDIGRIIGPHEEEDYANLPY